MKLCIITCYNQPDYIRARTLRAAASAIEDVEILVVKNGHKGILRYAEVAAKLIRARIRERPDAYLLTFRGYEMLFPVRILTAGKPLMYDEFINPIEWAVYEHNKLQVEGLLARLFKYFYKLLLLPVDLILTDTASHARLSAGMLGLSAKKFLTIAVGTDETTFSASDNTRPTNSVFTVLYYGNMLPLHGIKYVIEAATKLTGESIRFVLVGGSEKTARAVKAAVSKGANIEYKPWVEYDKLPALMKSADLCLAGPFGGTFQAQYVITGKAYQFLAMGKPTVVGVNKESDAFTDKHNALLVEQASATALTDTIHWAYEHREQLQAIGDEGRALYAGSFSNDQLAKILRVGLADLGLLKTTPPSKKK